MIKKSGKLAYRIFFIKTYKKDRLIAAVPFKISQSGLKFGFYGLFLLEIHCFSTKQVFGPKFVF